MANSRGQSSSIPPSKEFNIADIPQLQRDKLCLYLDQMSIWTELAKLMQLSLHDINNIRRRESLGESPSDQLLRTWGNVYNHTVTELFMLLYEKRLYSAMRMLKSFVPYQYHVLISNSCPALSELLPVAKAKSSTNQSEKVLNCSSLSHGSPFTTDDNYTTTSAGTPSSSSSPHQPQIKQPETAILSERSVTHYASSNLEINYEELSIATDNWSKENILGKGGFGTVYKGYWKHTEVAIKAIHYCSPNGFENIKVQIQQSLNELKYLNSFRHDNVLPLYGYSIRGDRPCLVYQFMRGGCLDKGLHDKRNAPLSLMKRVKISVGTARGINYIHTHTPDKPLIHGDIKPANVLLDECLMPKIGDFGLAREGPNAINMAIEVPQVFGTKCYLPPEFLNSKKLSTKVDTYSFGVTLLETFTGQRAYLKNRQLQLLTEHVATFFENPQKNVKDLLDPTLGLQSSQEYSICSEIFYLSLRCIAKNPDERPEMENVFEVLVGIFKKLEPCE